MEFNEEIIRRIVREEIERYFREKSVPEVRENPATYSVSVKNADESVYKKALEAMDATLGEQDDPKVGIFWYSPQLKDLFGVIAIDAATAPKSGGGLRTCKELHKYIWKKQHNYDKFHNISGPFNGDYKYTPRGRVFYDDEMEIFHIMVGAWIDEYPEAKSKILTAFNLDRPGLQVAFERGIHWEIGMGYGE